MRGFVHREGVYAYTGELPEGCKLCMRGTKLVVFITGLCRRNCFYCPVSPERMHRDVVYADEERVRSIDEIVLEAYRIEAEGASITGGEPLEVVGRVTRVIRALKAEFGDGFHIHLYTSGYGLTRRVVEELEASGLDELRVHIVDEGSLESLRVAVEARVSMKVGVEIPVDPARTEWVKRLAVTLEELNVDFLNLNELEVAPHKLEEFLARGYAVKGYVVRGSYEAGIEIVKWAAANLRRLSVHFCPASYKDRVQHLNRLVRKALRCKRFYERVTSRGTLEHCIVDYWGGCEEVGLRVGDKCLVDPSLAPRPCTLVETYPDSSRTRVSSIPLR